MYAVRHRVDGLFWMEVPSSPVRGAAAWIRDPQQARTFLSFQDAFDAAYVECPTPIIDLQIVDLEELEAIAV